MTMDVIDYDDLSELIDPVLLSWHKGVSRLNRRWITTVSSMFLRL